MTKATRTNVLLAAHGVGRQLARGVAVATLTGVGYFLTAWLGILLMREPFREASFLFPAGCFASGLLVVLGRRAWWPASVGVAVAAYAHIQLLPFASSVGQTMTYIVGDVAEVLIIAVLIDYFFGANFSLERLRHVVGLFAAALVSCTIVSASAAIAFKQFFIPAASALAPWHHIFTTLFTGVVSVAPMVIGLGAILRRLPSRDELLEATLAIATFAVATGAIVALLPAELWDTVLPAVLLFPFLVWLAVRCRPAFAAVGVFMQRSTALGILERHFQSMTAFCNVRRSFRSWQ